MRTKTITMMMVKITGVVSWLGPTTMGSSSITTCPLVVNVQCSCVQCSKWTVINVQSSKCSTNRLSQKKTDAGSRGRKKSQFQNHQVCASARASNICLIKICFSVREITLPAAQCHQCQHRDKDQHQCVYMKRFTRDQHV